MSARRIDKYKIPRSQVNVEATAQQAVSYLRYQEDDIERLAVEPVRRDKIIARFHTHPEFKPSSLSKDMVGTDKPMEDYDQYLAETDVAIAD